MIFLILQIYLFFKKFIVWCLIYFINVFILYKLFLDDRNLIISKKCVIKSIIIYFLFKLFTFLNLWSFWIINTRSLYLQWKLIIYFFFNLKFLIKHIYINWLFILSLIKFYFDLILITCLFIFIIVNWAFSSR